MNNIKIFDIQELNDFGIDSWVDIYTTIDDKPLTSELIIGMLQIFNQYTAPIILREKADDSLRIFIYLSHFDKIYAFPLEVTEEKQGDNIFEVFYIVLGEKPEDKVFIGNELQLIELQSVIDSLELRIAYDVIVKKDTIKKLYRLESIYDREDSSIFFEGDDFTITQYGVRNTFLELNMDYDEDINLVVPLINQKGVFTALVGKGKNGYVDVFLGITEEIDAKRLAEIKNNVYLFEMLLGAKNSIKIIEDVTFADEIEKVVVERMNLLEDDTAKF